MVKGLATTKRKHKTQALMGATRLASGIKAKAHTLLNKDSQTALIIWGTERSVYELVG